jgi:hypothetical protein
VIKILDQLVRAWRTEDPRELSSQLDQFQAGVDRSIRSIRSGVWPRLQERIVSGGTHRVQFGELLEVESTGTVVVVLPQITGADLGQVCGVLKTRPTGVVQLSAPRGSIVGAADNAAVPLRARGLRLYVATTRGWWSADTVPDSGEYTPTASNLENCTNARDAAGFWQKTGNIVQVSAGVLVDNDGASSPKQVELSVPIDPGANFSNFSSAMGAASSGTATTVNTFGGRVMSASGSRRIRISIDDTTSSGPRFMQASFQYAVANP